MKRTITTLALVAALSFVAGCDNNKKKTGAEVPPPAPAEQAPIAAPLPAPAPAPAPMVVEPSPLPPAPAPAARSGAKAGGTYVVQKGDTLFAISRKVYGNNSKVKDIIAANPGIDPNNIKVGQKLNLP